MKFLVCFIVLGFSVGSYAEELHCTIFADDEYEVVVRPLTGNVFSEIMIVGHVELNIKGYRTSKNDGYSTEAKIYDRALKNETSIDPIRFGQSKQIFSFSNRFVRKVNGIKNHFTRIHCSVKD